MATTPKKTYQFPRNQCIACNDIIHDRNHPLLLFGSSREGEKNAENFKSMFHYFSSARLCNSDFECSSAEKRLKVASLKIAAGAEQKFM